MESFIDKVRIAIEADNLDRIVIYGYASPDGPLRTNERLAQARCEAIAAYIAQQTGIGQEVIEARSGGVAWDELRRLVAENQKVPSREQVLKILDDTPSGRGGGKLA